MTSNAIPIAITTGLRTIFFQPRLATGTRLSFTNHSASCASTGISRTSFAMAASNACWWPKVAAFLPWRTRLIATRIARSIPGFSVIGAQPRSSSDLSGIVQFTSVIGGCRIEPGLEFAPPAANQLRQFAGFHFQERQQFRQGEFIEVEKGERTALRLGRGGNPDRQLLGPERSDLRRCVRRDLDFFQHAGLRLNSLFRHRDATLARLTEKP